MESRVPRPNPLVLDARVSAISGAKGGVLMSRTFHHGERRIRVKGVRRDPPDLRRLARALIELAQMEAEAQAEAEHKKRKLTRKGSANKTDSKTDRGDDA